MKLTLTLNCLLIWICCHSQDIASLKNQLKIETNIEKKTSLYIDVAWEYMLIENDSSLFYAEQGLEFARENDYPFGEVITLEMNCLLYTSPSPRDRG